MKSRTLALAAVVLVFAITGHVLRPLEMALRNKQEENSGMGSGRLKNLSSQRACWPVLLGGFRGVVADLLWLEASEKASEQDLAATETLLNWTTAIDPRPLYLWLNAARIIAYDMPTWRIEAAGGFVRVPERVQQRFRAEQAERAIRLLEVAKVSHPTSGLPWVEQANIQLNRLGDPVAAAESYRRAWEQPDGPYFAARLHGELLRRLGRKAEALDWLVKLHPHLPPANEAAGATLVLSRIRSLERELEVDQGRCYQPAGR